MRLVHNITASVFSETPEEMREAEDKVNALLPMDFEKQKLFWKEERCQGLEGKTIIVGTLVVTKEAHTNLFIKSLKQKLSSDDKESLSAQENRLDEELNFYLRLLKPRFMQGDCILTDSGNCVHIKMHIAAFPTKREVALGIVQKMWK